MGRVQGGKVKEGIIRHGEGERGELRQSVTQRGSHRPGLTPDPCRPSALPGGVQPAAGAAEEGQGAADGREEPAQDIPGQRTHYERAPAGHNQQNYVSLGFLFLAE